MGFPSPRYPLGYGQSLEAADDEQLLAAARKALERAKGRGALGVVEPGERVLVIVPSPPDQDLAVLDYFKTAFSEKSVTFDWVTEQEAGVCLPTEELEFQSAADGWKEVLWRRETAAMYPSEIAGARPRSFHDTQSRRHLEGFLDKHPAYTSIFVGFSGRSHWAHAAGRHMKRVRSNWIYWDRSDLLSDWSAFPTALIRMIEAKTLELLPQVREVKVTDAQGTEVRWSVSEEQARLWSEGADLTGHLLMYPLSARRHVFEIGEAAEERLVFPGAEGVIAGTSGHYGFFPHIRAYLENGVVTRIDGGGRYGELLRDLLAWTRDVQYPLHPEPGYFYLNELALGTNPKSYRKSANLFRTYSAFPNVSERNRSGVFHWGIGVHSLDPEIIEFGRARGLPAEHGWHVHTLFNTYRVRLASGEWRSLIDNGHLTALDDPEVVDLAASRGDPEAMLREDWIPAIPGVNYPGSYMEDFGRNPAAWIRQELAGELPSRIGVPG